MSKLLTSSLCAIALVLSTSANAKIYKWVDEAGNTHYTATPPPQNIESKEMKISGSKATASKEAKPKKKLSDKEQKALKITAKKECKVALKRIPAVLNQMEDIAETAFSFGSLSKDEYDQVKEAIKKDKNKLPSLSECVEDYQNDDVDREFVQCMATSDEMEGYTCIKTHAEKKEQL